MSVEIFSSSRKRVLGCLLLSGFFLGVLVKQGFLGADTFDVEYWAFIWTDSPSPRPGIFMGVFVEILSLLTVVVLNPVFFEKDRFVHLFFRVSFIAAFLVALAELIWLFGLSSYKGRPETLLVFQTSYSVETALNIRWWTHYLALFFSSIAGVSFFLVLMVKSLVPKWLSWWGLVGAFLLGLTMLIAMVGGGTYMLLMLPLGLNRLALAAWLLFAPQRQSQS